MGEALPPKPSKLVIGILAGSEELLAYARAGIESEYGPVQIASPVWPFDNTQYYQDEIGESILRQFVTLNGLFDIDDLPAVKLKTNAMEVEFSQKYASPAATRPINLDPGYLLLGKFVLATTKDYSHRLYIRDGIYAEVTLRYHSGGWHPWPWTYQDYSCGRYFDYFNNIRESLKADLKTPDSQ